MQPRAFLLDLDGTLYTSQGVIAGARRALAALRERGVPFRLITNTTMRSRDELLAHLEGLGFQVDPCELLTPSVVAAAILDRHNCSTVAPFVTAAALADLGDRRYIGGVSENEATATPQAIVVGDLGQRWDSTLMNEAFRYVMDGARFVALQKGRYWLGKSGLELDAGAYVAAIEYASGKQAIACGKPETPFFEAALNSLYIAGVAKVASEPIAMIGDDPWNDVHGAQQAGIEGWLVRTGKYTEAALQRSDVTPDRVLDSIADLI